MSLSVGNQVSGPVGRPLSISVLLACATRCAASRYLALSLSACLFLPATSDAFVSFFPGCAARSRFYTYPRGTRVAGENRGTGPLESVVTLHVDRKRGQETRRVASVW